MSVFLRPSLAIVLGFIGALIAKNSISPFIFGFGSVIFILVAFVGFGILGFLLPDILQLAGQAGIAALAKQISSHFPSPPVGNPFKRKKKTSNSKAINALVVDTSALIDGRLIDIVKTGFIYGTFLIIPSVITELHRLADNADRTKRSRGRRGLDALEELSRDKNIKVEILENEPDDEEVDQKLVKLARKIKGKVITVDFNLNKVARVSGVAVLNINDLANAVKTAVLPHERLTIKVNAVGREKDQGVGYLEDGTMVVIEGGAHLKGKTVEIVVHRVLQTAAGKMIFAKPA